jgi:hypothetical protein
VIEPGRAVVPVPECREKTCMVLSHDYRPESRETALAVDAGQWATVSHKCGLCGPKTVEQVWVPKIVETCVPVTELVCQDVWVEKTHVECRDVPTEVKFPIHTTSRRWECEVVYRHVPATTAEWIEEEVVIRVPFVSAQCVACRHVVETEDCPARDVPHCADRCGQARSLPALDATVSRSPELITPTPQVRLPESPQAPVAPVRPNVEI